MSGKSKIRAFVTARLLLLIILLALGPSVAHSQSGSVPGSLTPAAVENQVEAGGYYRVYIDDKLVLDNWTQGRALVGYVTLSLNAGRHKVIVEQPGAPGFLGARLASSDVVVIGCRLRRRERRFGPHLPSSSGTRPIDFKNRRD
jgi:hypothetical protein